MDIPKLCENTFQRIEAKKKEIPQQKLHIGIPSSSLKLSWGEANSATEEINTDEANFAEITAKSPSLFTE